MNGTKEASVCVGTQSIVFKSSPSPPTRFLLHQLIVVAVLICACGSLSHVVARAESAAPAPVDGTSAVGLQLLLQSLHAQEWESRNSAAAAATVLPITIVAQNNDDDNDAYPRPCIMKNGCECNSSQVRRYKDGQYYGVCTACADGWNGAFCESAISCLNGGVMENAVCECPIYFHGSVCEDIQCPNSIGGPEPYHILPVNPDTNICDACDDGFDGVNCNLCRSNAACALYAGDSGVCDSRIAIRGDTKQFQCSLEQPVFIMALGSGRNISAQVTLNCSSGSPGTRFAGQSDGQCSMTIHRIEENNAYRSPFFHCSARSCSMKTGAVEVAASSLQTEGSNVYLTLLMAGKTAMVVLCAALAGLGALTRFISRKTTRSTVYVMTVALCVVCIAYILLATVAMNATWQPSVTYNCEAVDCQCAEDPPSQYPPSCSSTLGETLSFVHGSLSITCNAETGACKLLMKELPIPFEVTCHAAECVNAAKFPEKETSTAGGGIVEPEEQRRSTNLLVFAFFFAVLTTVATMVHAYRQRIVSLQAAKEFVDIFHLSVTVDSSLVLSESVDDASTTAINEDTIDHSINGRSNNNASNVNGNSGTTVSVIPDLISTDDFTDESSEQAALVDTRRVVVRTQEQLELIERTRELTRSHLELSLYKLGYSLSPSLFGRDDGDDDGEPTMSKMILQQVTFTVRSGELLAIMGPSGAGKTTLLDILSARSKQGTITGDMALNGTSILNCGQRICQYRNIIGYVSQEDTLLPALTVKQTIRYAARLKLPMAFSNATIRNIVRQMISTLKLQRCANTLVGDGSGIRGISGGEKRRLSIAVELLANPRILFLDEPTSGLDAVSAMRTMEAVAELAKDSPMRAYAPYFFAFKPIVIFSIHQPSQEIFNMFDRVLLLSKGTTVYCGPASMALDTLSARMRETSANPNLCLPDLSDTVNHAELLMKLEERMTDGVRDALLEYGPPDVEQRSRRLAQQAVVGALATGEGEEHVVGISSGEGETNVTEGNETRAVEGADAPGVEILQVSAGFRRFYANTYEQVSLLTSRAASCLFSSFHLIVCHAGVTAVVSTLMCLLYSEQSLDLPGALNRAGSVTFLLLVVSFLSLSCLEQLVLERKLFVVERENGFYTTLPYLLSKIFVDIIPLRVIPVTVFASIIYFPMGLRTDNGIHFLWFILITTLFSVCATLLTMCVGIVNASFGASALLSSILILWNFVFGGLLVQAETIPSLLKPFKTVSPFFLTFESLLVNELDGQSCTFSPTDETGKASEISIPIVCRQYLSNIGLFPVNFNRNVTLLCMYCVALVLVAWLLLAKCTSIVR